MSGSRKKRVLVMSKVREILRLHGLGLSQNEIARSVDVSRSTVQDYVHRATERRLNFEDFSSFSEKEILELLDKKQSRAGSRALPDYQYVNRELPKKGVTLQLLWEEYRQQNPEGLSYGRFCHRYREWQSATRVSMRQNHKAGEKLFVDYAGMTVPIYRRGDSAVVMQAQIFVGVLGASNYTYVEATASQELRHWLGSHRRCFEYFGGVPRVVVPDNLKSGVNKACFYEPELNTAYKALAEHYQVAILPARVRKPKDKSKVEVGVQIVERWILAALRNRKFFSLVELNQEISKLLEHLNAKEMRFYGCSRRALFESVEKPVLGALPPKPYEFFDFKYGRVNIDYHVEVDKHYYSVPFQLVHQQVEIRIWEQRIEILHEGKRIAMHVRSREKYHHTTCKQHMPPEHQAMSEWTPSRFISWAEKVGPETKSQIEALLSSRQHPEQGYRACLGLLRLDKQVGHARLEAACRRANGLKLSSFKRIKSILDSGMDRLPIVELKDVPAVKHRNLRGGGYYN